MTSIADIVIHASGFVVFQLELVHMNIKNIKAFNILFHSATRIISLLKQKGTTSRLYSLHILYITIHKMSLEI